MRTYAEIYDRLAAVPPLTAAVAAAADPAVLSALAVAKERRICDAILIDDPDKLSQAAREAGIDLSDFKIEAAYSPQEAAVAATTLVKTEEADILMKGFIQTAVILRAVLAFRSDLAPDAFMSHVGVFELPRYDRLLLVTDPAFNIAPTLEQKRRILENAVSFAHQLGISLPRVAVLAAVETVNPAMPATLEAAELTRLNREGDIKGCIVDGPLSLDVALSSHAAESKQRGGEVAGQADILLVPDIEAGNLLYKAWIYGAECRSGGVLLGSPMPVVIPSRADSAEDKLNSIALACLQVIEKGGRQ